MFQNINFHCFLRFIQLLSLDLWCFLFFNDWYQTAGSVCFFCWHLLIKKTLMLHHQYKWNSTECNLRKDTQHIKWNQSSASVSVSVSVCGRHLLNVTRNFEINIRIFTFACNFTNPETIFLMVKRVETKIHNKENYNLVQHLDRVHPDILPKFNKNSNE